MGHLYLRSMALRNRDGSAYKLRGPNPTMSEQSLWLEKSVKLHNCRWQYRPASEMHSPQPRRVAVKDRPEDAPVIHESPVANDPSVSFYNDPISPLDVPIILAIDQQINDGGTLDGITKVAIHCLPAVVVEHVDKTYGETYRRPGFGPKFVFEAVMVEEQDLAILFWTTCQQATVGSVIYPMNKDKRWWEIKSREPKTGGLLVTAVMSSFNPSY
jgi:hypothetical protein